MTKILLATLLAVVLSTAAFAGGNQYALGVDGLAEGKTLSEEVARQAVKDAGFTLRSLEQIQGSE